MTEVLILAQVSIVSTAITQSALLNHEVYLIEYMWTTPSWKLLADYTAQAVLIMLRAKRCDIYGASASFDPLQTLFNS